MISTWFIVGQVLTLINYLVFLISWFIKNKYKILLWDNISRFFAIVSFIFLGTYDGIKNTLYVILRNILGQYTNKKKKKYKLLTLFISGSGKAFLSTLWFNVKGILSNITKYVGII